MNLLNITKLTLKITLFAICIVFYLQAASPIIPLLVKEPKEGSPKTVFSTNEQLTSIDLYTINLEELGQYKHVWQYRFDENKNIKQIQGVVGDITGNGKEELIIVIKGNDFWPQIYIFKLDKELPLPQPEIYSIKNIHNSSELLNLVLIKADQDKDMEIVVGFSSPERKILLFDYAINKLINTETIASQFLSDTWGPVFFHTRALKQKETEGLAIYSNKKKNFKHLYEANQKPETTEIANQSKIQKIINHNNKEEPLVIRKNTKFITGQTEIEGKNIKEIIKTNNNNLIIDKENTIYYFKKEEKRVNIKIKDPTMILLSPLYVMFSDLSEEKIQIFNLNTLSVNDLGKAANHQPIIEQEIVTNGETASLIIKEKLNTENEKTLQKNNDNEKIKKQEEEQEVATPKNIDTVFVNLEEALSINIPINYKETFLSLKTTLLPTGMTVNTDSLFFKWVPKKENIGFNYLKYKTIYQKNSPITQTTQNQTIELINNYYEEEVVSETIIYVNDPPVLKFANIPDTIYFKNKLKISWTIEDLNKEQKQKIKIANQEEFQGMIINNNQIIWEPTKKDFGKNEIQFIVSDGLTNNKQGVTVYVDTLLEQRVIDKNFIATTNKEFLYKLPQKPKSTHKQNKGPSNLWISPEGEIHWIPLATQIDSNYLVIESEAPGEPSLLQTFSIYVNSPPIISYRPAMNESVLENEDFIFQCQSFDMNKEAKINWSIDGENAQIDETGKINISATNRPLDNITYKVILSDGFDDNLFEGQLYVNSIPKAEEISPLYVQLGDTLKYSMIVEDKNKEAPFDTNTPNTLTYNLIEGPEQLRVSKGGIISWIPDPENLGKNEININVSDGISTIRSDFSIIVNDVPNIVSSDSISIELGDTLIHLFNVEDLDQQTEFFYNIKTSIDELLFNTKEGKLTWIPEEKDLGLHTLDISVSDSYEQSSSSQKLKIFVYQTPRLTNKPDTEAFIGLEYNYIPTAENMYKDTTLNVDCFISQFFLETQDSQYNVNNNQLKWIPKIEEIGISKLALNLKDQHGHTKNYLFDINTLLSPCETIDTLYINQKDTIRITTIDTLMIEIKDTVNTIKIDSIYINIEDSTTIINPKTKQPDTIFKIKKLYSPWKN